LKSNVVSTKQASNKNIKRLISQIFHMLLCADCLCDVRSFARQRLLLLEHWFVFITIISHTNALFLLLIVLLDSFIHSFIRFPLLSLVVSQLALAFKAAAGNIPLEEEGRYWHPWAQSGAPAPPADSSPGSTAEAATVVPVETVESILRKVAVIEGELWVSSKAKEDLVDELEGYYERREKRKVLHAELIVRLFFAIISFLSLRFRFRLYPIFFIIFHLTNTTTTTLLFILACTTAQTCEG
jgi:hypothetical protein